MINRMKSEKTPKKFSYEKLVKNDAGLLASGPNQGYLHLTHSNKPYTF